MGAGSRQAFGFSLLGAFREAGETISFSGGATDQQEGTLAPSRLMWRVILHHCSSTSPSSCHEHPIQSWEGVASGSFSPPDHEYPSHLEFRLTAVDGHGASATASRSLSPQTNVLTFRSTPSGLRILVGSDGGTTQFSRTVLRGSRTTISAITPQVGADGRTYEFVSWSDGGAATHEVVTTKNATYTASFRVLGADLRVTKSGSVSGTSVTWSITVTNAGPLTAESVVVTDTLPSGSTFVSASGPGCSYAPGTHVVTCSLGGLPVNASQTITIATTSTARGWITNTAQVTSSTPDPSTSSNTATARVRR